MKIIMKHIAIALFLVSLFNQSVAAQKWEKATKVQVELANSLHHSLKTGDQKGILDSYMQSAELSKLVKDQQGNLNPELVTAVINAAGRDLVKKGNKTLQEFVEGGEKMIDWSRVYLKYVWQDSVINTPGFQLDVVMIQFSHGAAKVWLQMSVANVDDDLHLCLLNRWKITRNGVVNLPIPESTRDLSKYDALRRSTELVIDLARFPKPITKADDIVPMKARAAVAGFERATSSSELGRHVFNCCVAGDFDAAGRALVPASLNSENEGLSAGQFEVLAALDLEKLYANSMVYWGFHWQDSVIKSVTEKEGKIIVAFNALMQLKEGETRKAELEFAIYGYRQIDGVWYLSTNPEYPTGISSVTMQGVTIDVSGLVEVSGRLTLDGKPLDNAVITMTPWIAMIRNGKAERGLNSRIPSGRTNAKGEFTMRVVYNSDRGEPVKFERIATNKYIVSVFDGTPVDPNASTLRRPTTGPDSKPGETKSPAQTVPQVFANPFGLKGDGRFLKVDQPLTAVLIKLTTEGKIEVVASSP
jgi:hypothetical protein